MGRAQPGRPQVLPSWSRSARFVRRFIRVSVVRVWVNVFKRTYKLKSRLVKIRPFGSRDFVSKCQDPFKVFLAFRVSSGLVVLFLCLVSMIKL